MSQKEFETYQPYIRPRARSCSGDVYYPVFHATIPDEFRLLAEKELNETEAKRKEGLLKLKEFTKGEKVFIGDETLLAFLRNQKFDIKKAEAKLMKFLPKRREIIKILRGMDTTTAETVIDDMGFGILPYRDKNGRIIGYTRSYGLRFDQYSYRHFAAVVAALGLMLLKYPLTGVTGVTYFGDSKGGTISVFYPYFKAVKEFLPTALSSPFRYSRIELLNPVCLSRWVFKALYPCLSKKIVERICFYGEGYSDLHKLYDPHILPEEFGGYMGPISNAFYKQDLLDYITQLKNES